eukprot:514584_1
MNHSLTHDEEPETSALVPLVPIIGEKANMCFGDRFGYGVQDDCHRSKSWYCAWCILFIVTIGSQITITVMIVYDLVYIFSNIQNWPVYGDGKEARGIIAIGKNAYGVIAIGQTAHGIICIGQICFGVISIGQVGLGLLFIFSQVGVSSGYGISQLTICTKVLYTQIGSALWNIHKSQLGFNVGSSIINGTKLIDVLSWNSNICICCFTNKVKHATYACMNSIRYPRFWPNDTKRLIAQMLPTQDINQVIEYIVYETAKAGYYGLDEMNKDEIEHVIDELSKQKEKFKRIAMQNFTSDSL